MKNKNILNQNLPIKIPKSNSLLFALSSDEKNNTLSSCFFWTIITCSIILATIDINNINTFLNELLYTKNPKTALDAIKNSFLAEWTYWRGLLLYITIGFLLYYAISPLHKFSKLKVNQTKSMTILLLSIAAFSLLCILVYPIEIISSTDGNVALTKPTYIVLSEAPFESVPNPYYKRLLSVSLAHLLFFRGKLLFTIYTYITIIALFYICIALFLQCSNTQIIRFSKGFQSLPFLVFLAFCTTSSIFSFFPFNTIDPTTFIIVILLISIPNNQRSVLSLITLLLINHEISIFLIIPILSLCYPTKLFLKGCFILSWYIIFWQLSLPPPTSYLDGMHKWAFDIVLNNPFKWLISLGISFKFFWLLIVYITYYLISKKNWHLLLVIYGFISSGILASFVAVDTTRIIGFAFIGFLISICTILSVSKNTKRDRYWLQTTCILTILTPSAWGGAYISTQTGLIFQSGLYLHYARALRDLFLLL